jgi:hypothetical protein
MDAMWVAKNRVSITLSPGELAFLSNAINETLEALEDWEFKTRTGVTRERATEMLAQLHKLLEEASRGDSP